jgi:2-C-methyl-D-erythritol 4-phosphate cytidylyltransferase
VRAGGGAPLRAGAILAAAGRGARLRLGDEVPKALVDLRGRPLAAHSLAVLEAAPFLVAVVLVVPIGMRDRFKTDLVDKLGFRKVEAIVEGGPTRRESVGLGLDALRDDLDPVIIHDAARPLVTSELISACVLKAAVSGACVPGLCPRDTIKAVTAKGVVEATLDRQALREIQTPQVFRTSLIKEAHRMAREGGSEATDDAALVERMGEPVAVIEGDPDNLKITRAIDLDIAAAVLGRREAGGVT